MNYHRYKQGRKSGAVVHRAVKSKALTRKVKRIVSKDQEQKYIDTVFSSSGFNDAGLLTKLTPINQGNAQQQRVGDRVLLKNVQFNLSSLNATNLGVNLTANPTRLILFLWESNDAIADDPPTVADIIQYPGVITSACSPLAFQTRKGGRAKFLLDKTFWHYNDVINSVQIKFKKLLKDRRIQFNAGVATGDGHLYCLFLSNAVANSSLYGYTRVIYTDS